MNCNSLITSTPLIALLLAAGLSTGCSDTLGCVQGSNVFRSDVRRAAGQNPADPPFTHVTLEGSVDVVLAERPYSIVVEGDDNLVGLVTATVSNGTLVVDNKECYTSARPLIVRVSLPKLDGIVLDGSGDVSATTAFTADLFTIVVAGSGDVAMQVEDGELRTTSSGSGDITLAGHASLHSVELSGSGDLDALDLQTERTTYRSTGSGDGRIAVSQSLVVTMSGSGDLAYRGSPAEYQANVTGSGDITRIP